MDIQRIQYDGNNFDHLTSLLQSDNHNEYGVNRYTNPDGVRVELTGPDGSTPIYAGDHLVKTGDRYYIEAGKAISALEEMNVTLVGNGEMDDHPANPLMDEAKAAITRLVESVGDGTERMIYLRALEDKIHAHMSGWPWKR